MPNWTTTGTLAVGSALMVYYIGRLAAASQTARPLPPGPSGLPWIGNVIGFNLSAPWLTYAEWKRTYGDIVYSRLLGTVIIVVNSEKIANDLLDKRGNNYSDRPHLAAAELLGVTFDTLLKRYGDQWRLHRRFLNQTFRPDAVPRFVPYQRKRSSQLLQRLLDAPEQLHDHVFEYTAAVGMNSVYGYDPASRKDAIVDMAADVLNIVMPALRPDVALATGMFPSLRDFTSLFPGMPYKEEAAKARGCAKDYVDIPFEYSRRQESSGNVAPTMIHDGLQHIEEKGASSEESWKHALKEASSTAFLASALASESLLSSFFLLMMLNPAVQEKAQAQIDAVVGKGRLPTIEDRPSLPYIDAIFWETLRYRPPTPLSFAHAALNDDEYNGFHIPKGAIILPNVWSMAHDESRFPDANAFLPERFLNRDGSLKPIDIEHVVFGFGRRMCPGRHLAEMTLWSAIAKVLAIFKILKPLDKNGAEITVEPKYSNGLIIHPLPFESRIVTRSSDMDSKKLEELITATTS